MRPILFITLLFCGLCSTDLSAQASNRMKVIALLLKKHEPAKIQLTYNLNEAKSNAFIRQDAGVRYIAFSDPIPKFQLPRGAIVCRFEEYVQLHSPFKLNIGVGGE
jgi:hypothetical protein